MQEFLFFLKESTLKDASKLNFDRALFKCSLEYFGGCRQKDDGIENLNYQISEKHLGVCGATHRLTQGVN